MITSISKSLKEFYVTGDIACLDEFYRQSFSFGYRSAFYITHSAADAEDVMQISYFSILKAKSKCQAALDLNEEKTVSWFLSIVLNNARMLIRAKERRMKKETEVREIRESATTQQGGFITDDENLLNAIYLLPEKYRTPILLKYHGGMNNSEIESALSINNNTLKSLLRRGLTKLKSLLKDPAYAKTYVLISALSGLEFKDVQASEITFEKYILPHVVDRLSYLLYPRFLGGRELLVFFQVIAVVSMVVMTYSLSGNNKFIYKVKHSNNQKLWKKTYDKNNFEFYPLDIISGEFDYIDGKYLTKENELALIKLPERLEYPYRVDINSIMISPKNIKKLKSWEWTSFGVAMQNNKSLEIISYYKSKSIIPTIQYKLFDYRNNYSGIKHKSSIIFTSNKIFMLHDDKITNYGVINGIATHSGLVVKNRDIISITISACSKEELELMSNIQENSIEIDVPRFLK